MSRVWGYTMKDGEVHGEIFNVGEVPTGWKFSPADLKAEPAPAVEATDKDALIAEAEALGLTVDRRYSAKRVASMIAEVKAHDDSE